ncbi:MAG TPA: outer membrane beta-barrel protein [Opitutaceae bacterium]|nr:outer membrane beta-barrel protein [Opitutaceae bacterium]
MTHGREIRATLATLLASLIACPPVQALVALNDGHDRIFVNLSASVSQDSNVFANSDNSSDLVTTSSLSAEYTRRAGWIGVNAHASVVSSSFATFSNEDFVNPSLSMELTKQTGRTTGAFAVNAARESRADAAVNVRSDSWNYGSSLSIKYPIVSTYTASANFGWASREYLDNAAFFDLATYNASFDLFHILTTDREILAGYRYRLSETARDTSTSDHSATVGLSGRLIRGVTGSLRAGYQTRIPEGGRSTEAKYSSWTASAASSYAFSRKLNFSGNLSKDFSTTANDSSVDVISAGVDAQYAYSPRWTLTASAGFSDSRYIGDSGRVPISIGTTTVLGPNRHDNYANWGASVAFSLNDHFKIAANYTWFENWSTLPLADFVRTAWTLNVSSRW